MKNLCNTRWLRGIQVRNLVALFNDTETFNTIRFLSHYSGYYGAKSNLISPVCTLALPSLSFGRNYRAHFVDIPIEQRFSHTRI